VTTPDWYGFPDICGDGLPVWHESHLPDKGRPAEQLIADPPPWAGPAAFLEKPHSCLTKMDFCRSRRARGELAPAAHGGPGRRRDGREALARAGPALEMAANAIVYHRDM